MIKILTHPYSLISGRILKNSLEELLKQRIIVTKNPSRIRGDDYLIRYGYSEFSLGNNIGNDPEFISLVSNKKYLSNLIKEKIYTPEFSQGIPEVFPVLIRTSLTSSGGRGIIVCKNLEEFNANWMKGFYWTPYIPTTFELRVHVVNGKVVKIFKKISLEIEESDSLPIRNLKNGYHFSLVSLGNYPKVSDVVNVLETFSEIGGQLFYAADLGWDYTNKKYFLYEINSAPGLNSNTAQLYAQAIVDKLGV